MTISRTFSCSFITELVTRNPNLGIPALEDGLFAKLLIFNYLYFWEGKRNGKGKGTREAKKGREKRREKGREKGKGKGKGKGRDKGKGITKIARVPSCEVGSTVIRDYTVL